MTMVCKRVSLTAAAFAAALLLSATALAATASAETYTLETQPPTQYSDAEQVHAVPLQKGAVKLELTAGQSYATARLYATADCSGSSMVSAYTQNAYQKKTVYAPIAKSTTYYLKITSRTPGATVSTSQYKTTGTLKSGKVLTGTSCGDNTTVAMYKFVSKNRGYVDLHIADIEEDYGSYEVQLLNNKKKALTGWANVSMNYPVYGHGIAVSKGTYYIAVKSRDAVYTILPTFKAVKTAVKTKKSKAASLKKGKAVKAVLAGGEKTAWYKFKNTSKHKVKLYVDTNAFAEGITVEAFDSRGSMGTRIFNNSYRVSETLELYDLLSKKLPKGTYYIKVSSNKKGCGYYSLKWK